jgi:hypothetical protein
MVPNHVSDSRGSRVEKSLGGGFQGHDVLSMS